MRWGLLAISLSGCNQVLGLTPTAPIDAPVDAGRGPSDEDGDGINNDDDTCPSQYNPDQTVDGDGDGVGDVCDPNPTTPGDRIVAREMFSGPLYSWTPDSSTSWTLIDGRLQTSPVTLGAVRRLTFSTTAPHPTLEMGFAVNAYSMDALNAMDVAVATTNSFVHGAIGGVPGVSPGEPIYLAQLMHGSMVQYTIELLPPILAGPENVVIVSRFATSASLEINGHSASSDIPTIDANISAVIEVREMQVSITYLVLYAFD